LGGQRTLPLSPLPSASTRPTPLHAPTTLHPPPTPKGRPALLWRLQARHRALPHRRRGADAAGHRAGVCGWVWGGGGVKNVPRQAPPSRTPFPAIMHAPPPTPSQPPSRAATSCAPRTRSRRSERCLQIRASSLSLSGGTAPTLRGAHSPHFEGRDRPHLEGRARPAPERGGAFWRDGTSCNHSVRALGGVGGGEGPSAGQAGRDGGGRAAAPACRPAYARVPTVSGPYYSSGAPHTFQNPRVRALRAADRGLRISGPTWRRASCWSC
jgi:hypothetical protein